MESLRLMLVEDDIEDVCLFSDALSEAKPELTYQLALNGRDAFNDLEAMAELPHLLLLDLVLPLVTGLELLAKIKAHDRLKDVPVFVLSGTNNPRQIEAALKLGAACFLIKPDGLEPMTRVLNIIIDTLPGNLSQTIALLSKSGRYVRC